MLNIWSTVSVLHLSRFINSFSSNLVWYLCSLALSCGWALADGWGTLNMDWSVFNHLMEQNYPEVTIFSCGTARFHRRSISFYEWIENFFIFIWIILCVTKHFILRSNCDRIEVGVVSSLRSHQLPDWGFNIETLERFLKFSGDCISILIIFNIKWHDI